MTSAQRLSGRPRRSRAFTLTELLITTIIIGVLTSLIVVAYQQAADRGSDAAAAASMLTIMRAATVVEALDEPGAAPSGEVVEGVLDESSDAWTLNIDGSPSLNVRNISYFRSAERSSVAVLTPVGGCAFAVSDGRNVQQWYTPGATACSGVVAENEFLADEGAPLLPVPTTTLVSDGGLVLAFVCKAVDGGNIGNDDGFAGVNTNRLYPAGVYVWRVSSEIADRSVNFDVWSPVQPFLAGTVGPLETQFLIAADDWNDAEVRWDSRSQGSVSSEENACTPG